MITASLCCHPLSCCRRINISIADYWNADRFLNSAYLLPISLAAVKLFPGSGVNSNPICTSIFNSLSYFHTVDAVLIPTQPNFYCYRNLHTCSYCRYNLTNQLRLLQQGGTVSVLNDFRSGTAHI